jgi:hypothetical protein
VVVGGKQGPPCTVASGWLSLIKGTSAHTTEGSSVGPTSTICGIPPLPQGKYSTECIPRATGSIVNDAHNVNGGSSVVVVVVVGAAVVVLVVVDVLVDVLVDVDVLVLVDVEVLVDVDVEVLVLVEVLVDVLVELLLVVVVVGIKSITIKIAFVHTPVDCTLITVVPLGTTVDVYPAIKAAADIPVSNGTENPSVFEYRSKGPASPPIGNTNVINVVIFL